MRLSKYEKNMLRSQKRKAAMEGKGLFVFRNNTSGDLYLPQPTKSGVTKVAVNEEFQGSDYYMYMVRNNELRLVRQIESPDAPPQVLNEEVETQMADKLITEQPPVVTNEGTVEFVEKDEKKQKLNENKPAEPQAQPDILLNENPMDGIEII